MSAVKNWAEPVKGMIPTLKASSVSIENEAIILRYQMQSFTAYQGEDNQSKISGERSSPCRYAEVILLKLYYFLQR